MYRLLLSKRTVNFESAVQTTVPQFQKTRVELITNKNIIIDLSFIPGSYCCCAFQASICSLAHLQFTVVTMKIVLNGGLISDRAKQMQHPSSGKQLSIFRLLLIAEFMSCS